MKSRIKTILCTALVATLPIIITGCQVYPPNGWLWFTGAK